MTNGGIVDDSLIVFIKELLFIPDRNAFMLIIIKILAQSFEITAPDATILGYKAKVGSLKASKNVPKRTVI